MRKSTLDVPKLKGVISKVKNEQRAISLLVGPKAYSSTHSFELRKELIHFLMNQSPRNEHQLRVDVTSSINSLNMVSHSPLEIADLLLAWKELYPYEVEAILCAASTVYLADSNNAQGLALGMIELVQHEDIRMVHVLVRILNGVFHGRNWDIEKCPIYPCLKGRMGSSLASVVQGIWVDLSENRALLTALIHLVNHRMKSELKKPCDHPTTLYDYLISEILAKIYHSAPLAYQIIIMQSGLHNTVQILSKVST